MIASGLPHEWWLMRAVLKKGTTLDWPAPHRQWHAPAPPIDERHATDSPQPAAHHNGAGHNGTCAGLSMNKHKQRADGAEWGGGMTEKGEHKGKHPAWSHRRPGTSTVLAVDNCSVRRGASRPVPSVHPGLLDPCLGN